jgi:hypothetical protein
MAQFKVVGLDPKSNRRMKLLIDVPAEADAEAAARKRGMQVERVELVPIEVAPHIEPPAPPTELPPVPDVIDYQGSRAVGIPDYRSIVEGANAIDLIATIVRVAAIISVIVGVLVIVIGSRLSDSAQIAEGIALLFGAVFGFAGAVILRMGGALALAMRDVARNSFK